MDIQQRHATKTGIYRPRNQRNTSLYQLIEDYFLSSIALATEGDDFCSVYEQQYEPRAGPLRSVVTETVHKYLDCGLLENGFCRVYCDNCKKDFLVALSCKSRYFCRKESGFDKKGTFYSLSTFPTQEMTTLWFSDAYHCVYRSIDGLRTGQWHTILRILKHLELWPPQSRAPPNKKKIAAHHHPAQETSFSYEADFFGP